MGGTRNSLQPRRLEAIVAAHSARESSSRRAGCPKSEVRKRRVISSARKKKKTAPHTQRLEKNSIVSKGSENVADIVGWSSTKKEHEISQRKVTAKSKRQTSLRERISYKPMDLGDLKRKELFRSEGNGGIGVSRCRRPSRHLRRVPSGKRSGGGGGGVCRCLRRRCL